MRMRDYSHDLTSLRTFSSRKHSIHHDILGTRRSQSLLSIIGIFVQVSVFADPSESSDPVKRASMFIGFPKRSLDLANRIVCLPEAFFGFNDEVIRRFNAAAEQYRLEYRVRTIIIRKHFRIRSRPCCNHHIQIIVSKIPFSYKIASVSLTAAPDVHACTI